MGAVLCFFCGVIVFNTCQRGLNLPRVAIEVDLIPYRLCLCRILFFLLYSLGIPELSAQLPCSSALFNKEILKEWFEVKFSYYFVEFEGVPSSTSRFLYRNPFLYSYSRSVF